MKYLIHLGFLLISIASFGQQTYKVTEGEFQFINPSIGIVVKKNNQYFNLAFYSDKKDGEITHHYNQLNPYDSYIRLFRDDNIPKNKIDKNPDFKNLKNVCFFEETDDENYSFSQINKSHFAGFTLGKSGNHVNDDRRYLPFITVKLNDLKLIVFINSSLVIYKSNKKYCISSNNFTKANFSVKMSQNNPSLQEITKLSTSYDANNIEEYRIKKTKNGKYQIRTILNEDLIKKTYDTIYLQNLIVCKNNKDYDLYNFRYKKINKSKIEGFATLKDKIQIIQNNELKTINYEGNPYNPKDFPLDNKTFVTYGNEMPTSRLEYSRYEYIKLDNGKFNLDFFEEHPFLQVENNRKELFKNLDSILLINEGLYKIEKNNLFTYYPIIKEIKYSKLGVFQGNFARFELPNGKKGWLSLDGNEYFDK